MKNLHFFLLRVRFKREMFHIEISIKIFRHLWFANTPKKVARNGKNEQKTAIKFNFNTIWNGQRVTLILAEPRSQTTHSTQFQFLLTFIKGNEYVYKDNDCRKILLIIIAIYYWHIFICSFPFALNNSFWLIANIFDYQRKISFMWICSQSHDKTFDYWSNWFSTDYFLFRTLKSAIEVWNEIEWNNLDPM